MDKKLYIDMLDNDEKKYIIEIFSEQSMESIENILVKSQELFCSERRQENKEKDKALVQYWLQQAYQWLEKVGNNDCFYPILMLSVSLLPKKLNKEDCLPSLKKVERFIIYAAEYVYINKVVPKEEIEKRNKWVIENKKDFSRIKSNISLSCSLITESEYPINTLYEIIDTISNPPEYTLKDISAHFSNTSKSRMMSFLIFFNCFINRIIPPHNNLLRPVITGCNSLSILPRPYTPISSLSICST